MKWKPNGEMMKCYKQELNNAGKSSSNSFTQGSVLCTAEMFQLSFERVKWAVRAHKGCAGDVFSYYV